MASGVGRPVSRRPCRPSEAVNWVEDRPEPGLRAGTARRRSSWWPTENSRRGCTTAHWARRARPRACPGPQRFATPGGALDYCEAELGAVDPVGGTPAERLIDPW